MKNRICFLLAAMILIILVCTACAPKEPASSEMPQSSSTVQSAPVVSPEPSAVSATLEPVSQSEPEAEPEPELTEREKNWRADLAYFKRNYATHHVDPFYNITEKELDWQLEQLEKKVPELSDTDIYFELAKIGAQIDDAHSYFVPPDEIYEKRFPFGVRYIEGKPYLIAYWEKYDQFEPYLLHEIVSVNGVDIEYLKTKAESITAPLNKWRGMRFFERYYFVPAFFDWADCDYKEGYTIEFLDDNQKVVSVETPIITQDDDVGEKQIISEGFENTPYYVREKCAYLVEGEQGCCVVVKLDRAFNSSSEAYCEIFEAANALIAEHPDAKLALDLRGNGGGNWDAARTIGEDFSVLKKSGVKQAYVLTDGDTQSASIHVLHEFQEQMGALQVGEPTGQFPLFFYGNARITLPQSQFTMLLSNNSMWEDDMREKNAFGDIFYDEDSKLYPWENTVLPDVYISQTIEDTKAGKDSAIEWIIKQ